MPYVEEPTNYRTGLFQLRPALLGWQYRWRPYGQPWRAWRFVFGRRDRCRERVLVHLGSGFVEAPLKENDR